MPQKQIHTIQVFPRKGQPDLKADKLQHLFQKQYHVDSGRIMIGKLYILTCSLEPELLLRYAHSGLGDPIVTDLFIDQPLGLDGYTSAIIVAKLPGVTDDEGMSAQKSLIDITGIAIPDAVQQIFSQEIYAIENTVPVEVLKEFAETSLCNKLINHITCGTRIALPPLYVPEVHLHIDEQIEAIPISVSDEALLQLSHERLLALNLEEMQAVKAYYADPAVRRGRVARNLPPDPTDCELEIIAQTWSEHCKHKEFNATIQYTNTADSTKKTITSLFKTYIKAATDNVAGQIKAKNQDWLIKVFSDNAGIVKINDEDSFVWKVETHNSPSAIDPYGGAITGILGNNRDPLGTGMGGAKLLFNTNVLCFGPPSYAKPLLKGQLHPKRIFEGVRKGIEDGGNKSGIPTVNGAIIFDDRYSGKPLVYCGTGGVLKRKFANRPTPPKTITPGDLIISIGGRVGKDGIHGATFSSRELDEHSPQSAVQIGSPIVQKLASDFLEVACARGLIHTTTDCGAGGLSSAIGELAAISNGAVVQLDQVRLKYSGLKPWEIFLSESQERMILAIEPQFADELFALAQHMEVEAAQIGVFTDSGTLEIKYKDSLAAVLHLDFLHDGVPGKFLEAEWKKPADTQAGIPEPLDHKKVLLALLRSDNIASREAVIRQYDHEVKGKTIIKPLMGRNRKAPQDAAVVRVNFDSFEGIAVANGIMPKYADIDPYNSSAGAFDEAIRQIIAVGGKLPLQSEEEIFWSVNDNFCVPDSVYHPELNPDGKQKLAQLVQMCEALYAMSTYFSIPMTSGKDSMKNDFKADGVKISVPPTLLYSAAAKIPDIRKTMTADFKVYDSLIYHVGTTYNEPGASELYRYLGLPDNRVPVVRKENAKQLYLKMMQAHAAETLLSAHDISDGGLLVALAECCFGMNFGAEISLEPRAGLSVAMQLYAESHSRFVVSVDKNKQHEFEQIMGNDATLLGFVTLVPELRVFDGEEIILSVFTEELLSAWSNGLQEQML
jgi:phosphoribosylformylglycinamidine synthase